jgi:hypothetical protein
MNGESGRHGEDQACQAERAVCGPEDSAAAVFHNAKPENYEIRCKWGPRCVLLGTIPVGAKRGFADVFWAGQGTALHPRHDHPAFASLRTGSLLRG